MRCIGMSRNGPKTKAPLSTGSGPPQGPHWRRPTPGLQYNETRNSYPRRPAKYPDVAMAVLSTPWPAALCQSAEISTRGHVVYVVMVRAGRAMHAADFTQKAWIPAFAGMAECVPPKSQHQRGAVLFVQQGFDRQGQGEGSNRSHRLPSRRSNKGYVTAPMHRSGVHRRLGGPTQLRPAFRRRRPERLPRPQSPRSRRWPRR
jgi:hypothetical protein